MHLSAWQKADNKKMQILIHCRTKKANERIIQGWTQKWFLNRTVKKLASSKRLQEVVAHQISKKNKKKLVRDAQNWGIYSNVLTQNTIRENEWMATMPTCTHKTRAWVLYKTNNSELAKYIRCQQQV